MSHNEPTNFQPPPRVVKPRGRQHKPLPVIAIQMANGEGDDVALDEDGQLYHLTELLANLPALPRTLFVAMGSADLLAYFDDDATRLAYGWPDSWQWRTSAQERRAYAKHPDPRARKMVRRDIVVHWFGFHHQNYHRIIDPVTMYAKRFDEIWPPGGSLVVRLMQWATTLRDWCAENNLEVKPTLGGISSQLLTDPRFYPKARRKVPAKTNEAVREHLPGNHYKLNIHPSPHRDYRATYIDQHRAHHYHARLLHFPHADHLYAYGYFYTLNHYYREKPAKNFMGLYCLDLLAPRRGKHYSWLSGLEKQFVFTNELPHLYDMGFSVTGVRAAWGSNRRDTGLNKLAAWACTQPHKPWLKPLLLSTYGTLATRPTFAEAVFKQAKRGKETTMLTGKRALTGLKVQRPRRLEPGFVNVLQRGMIEAATRSETIGLAQHLETRGQRVLSLYADAVIIETDDDRPLPPLPEPWEVKKTLNHYQPINLQSFKSDTMTKTPGMPGRDMIPFREASHKPPHRNRNNDADTERRSRQLQRRATRSAVPQRQGGQPRTP